MTRLFKCFSLLVMLSLLTGMELSAKKIKISDGKVKFTLDTSDKTASVTGYEDAQKEKMCEIPEVIMYQAESNSGNYKVTSIAAEAFVSARLKSITMPNTIKTIGKSAFEVNNLSSLTLPGNLTEIGANAFKDAFSGKTFTLTLPSKLTSIGQYAFSGAPVTSIVFNKKLTTIGKFAFESTKLTSLAIPAQVTSIGAGAFSGCPQLQSVTISAPLTRIPDQMFDACRQLRSVSLPASVTELGTWAFATSESLTAYPCPATVKVIGEGAFENSGLTSAILPEGVTTVGKKAFNGCPNLATVQIPSTVTSIGDYCFDYSKNVLTIRVNRTVPPALGTCGFDSNSYWNASLNVPANTYAVYHSAHEWNNFSHILDPSASIEDVASDGDAASLGVTAVAPGQVVVSGADGRDVAVYTIDGRRRWHTAAYDGTPISIPAITTGADTSVSPAILLLVSGRRTLKLHL